MIRARVRPTWRAVAGALVAGAVVGTALDRLHTAGGTLTYAKPGAFGQPWWVPVEFGVAYAAGVLAFPRLGDPVPDRRSWVRAAGELAWLAAVYAMTAAWWRSPAALSLVMAVLLLARIPTLQRVGSANAVPVLALVAGGPVVEAFISAGGLFAYAKPDLLGIPVWLPLLYMHATPFAVRFVETLLWFGAKRRVAREEEKS